MNSFIINNSQSITIRSTSYIYIQSSIIPPRSTIRTQLVSDGWKHKNKLSRLFPFSCFIINESDYNNLYLPSPEEIEDMLYIELYQQLHKLEEEEYEYEEEEDPRP